MEYYTFRRSHQGVLFSNHLRFRTQITYATANVSLTHRICIRQHEYCNDIIMLLSLSIGLINIQLFKGVVVLILPVFRLHSHSITLGLIYAHVRGKRRCERIVYQTMSTEIDLGTINK